MIKGSAQKQSSWSRTLMRLMKKKRDDRLREYNHLLWARLCQHWMEQRRARPLIGVDRLQQPRDTDPAVRVEQRHQPVPSTSSSSWHRHCIPNSGSARAGSEMPDSLTHGRHFKAEDDKLAAEPLRSKTYAFCRLNVALRMGSSGCWPVRREQCWAVLPIKVHAYKLPQWQVGTVQR